MLRVYALLGSANSCSRAAYLFDVTVMLSSKTAPCLERLENH